MAGVCWEGGVSKACPVLLLKFAHTHIPAFAGSGILGGFSMKSTCRVVKHFISTFVMRSFSKRLNHSVESFFDIFRVIVNVNLVSSVVTHRPLQDRWAGTAPLSVKRPALKLRPVFSLCYSFELARPLELCSLLLSIFR